MSIGAVSLARALFVLVADDISSMEDTLLLEV